MVQHDVVAGEDFGEVPLLVVHHDVGAEAAHQLRVLAAGGGGHRGAEVWASWITVDPRPPEPAWTRTFWPGFRWARSTRPARQPVTPAARRRLVQGERVWLGVRGRPGRWRDVLGEGPDPQVAGAA